MVEQEGAWLLNKTGEASLVTIGTNARQALLPIFG